MLSPRRDKEEEETEFIIIVIIVPNAQRVHLHFNEVVHLHVMHKFSALPILQIYLNSFSVV